jgi:hypothetical protein
LFKRRARFFSKGRLSQKCKNRVRSFKNLLLKKHWARRAHIYMKAFWYNVDLSLIGVGRGHNRVKHIYICFNGKNLSKSFQETPDPKKFKFTEGIQCITKEKSSTFS